MTPVHSAYEPVKDMELPLMSTNPCIESVLIVLGYELWLQLGVPEYLVRSFTRWVQACSSGWCI